MWMVEPEAIWKKPRRPGTSVGRAPSEPLVAFAHAHAEQVTSDNVAR